MAVDTFMAYVGAYPNVAAAEEGTTQETPPTDRPGYEPERPAVDDAVATAPAAAPSEREKYCRVQGADRSSATPRCAPARKR